MEYVPPYGRETEGEAAHYINGDPSQGIQGSIPPANAFEHPMREIVGVIEKSLIVPSPADLLQLTEAIRSQRLNYVLDTGSVNNISVAFDPPLAAYTQGLLIRVRILNTNTGPCRINAGAGLAAIRKMSGADVAAGDLPAGGIADLVFDGTVFQLVNYGGVGSGGGPGTVYEVKIPYCVDTSTTPGIITANFSPAITTLNPGDELAVKIANTAPGSTIMNVNSLPAISCFPNGGGEMLQGDMHAGNVVIFFYDGSRLYFQPDPSIDAPVTYQVGSGQHWSNTDQAMSVLARKAIGPNGHVTLQLQHQTYPGPISINHPNADRITVAGTMIGSTPAWNEFYTTGSDPASLARDAANNIAMLRTRYGTEVQVATALNSVGLVNNGPGQPVFQDILVTGSQMPVDAPGTGPHQVGVFAPQGHALYGQNVAVWGTQAGFDVQGDAWLTSCKTSGTTAVGYFCGGNVSAIGCWAFGSYYEGWDTPQGHVYSDSGLAYYNGRNGIRAYNGGQIDWSRSWSQYNYVLDEYAAGGAGIWNIGAQFSSTSPAANQVGNVGATITSGPYPTSY